MKRNKLAVAVSMVVGLSPLGLTAQECQVPDIQDPEVEEVVVMG